MTRQIEQDRLLLTRLLALQGLLDRASDGVTGLRSRDDALGTREQHARLEGLRLVEIHRLHQSVLHQLRHDHTRAVITQTAGMDRRRLEGMADRVHREQGSQTRLVAEVILELAPRQFRAGSWFRRDEPRLLAILDVVTHERIRDAAEVGTAAEAGDDDIRILARQRHLLLRLQADDGLVQTDVIQHGTERVLAVRRRNGQFDGLRNRTAQGTLVVGIHRQDILAGTGGHRRGRGDRRAESLHDGTAVRLLVVTGLDHIHRALDAELLGRIGKGAAPLAGSGLRGDIGDTLLLGVIGLRQGGIQLVRTRRGDTLVLEIDVGRRAESRLELIGTHQRRAAVGRILLADRLRNGNPFVDGIELLLGTLLAEDRVEVFRLECLPGAGMEDGLGLVGHNRLDVEPCLRDLAVRENEFFLFHDTVVLIRII